MRMGVEFIKKIHNGICLKTRGTNDDVLFVLSPMSGITSSQLLPFHPRESELFELRRENDKSHANHDDHKELRRPDVGHIVTVAHRGKGNDDVINGLE